jgi:hypothetical protein
VVDPETQDEPLVPRKTLKLKKRPVKQPPPSVAAVNPEPTRWIDENKRRMQAEMDALGFGTEPTKHRRSR